MKRGIVGLSLMLLAACSGGCVSVHSIKSYSGSRVSAEVFKQVKDGETARDWLIEALGPPTVVEDRGDGMEDLIYEATRRVDEHFNVLLVISLENSFERVQQWIFELKDGVVHRHYRRTIRLPFAEDDG